MSKPETAPEDLIAEFHRVTGVRPGNVVYEAPLFVFKYPRTQFSEDRLTRARLEEIIADERRRQGYGEPVTWDGVTL